MPEQSIISANALPCDTGDQVVVSIWTALPTPGTTFVHIRQLDETNQLIDTIETINVVTADFPTVGRFRLTRGHLIAVNAYFETTGIPVGQVFANIAFQTGDVATAIRTTNLTSGYIPTGGVINWPFTKPVSVSQPPRFYNLDSVVDPVAGANFSSTVNANLQQILRSASFRLTTAAVAATRTVNVSYSFGGGLQVKAISRTTQIISQVRDYFLWAGPNLPADTAAISYIPIPEHSLVPNLEIDVTCTNIDPADEFTDIKFMFDALTYIP